MAKGKVVLYPEEIRKLRYNIGFGMLNFGHAVEAGAKREAPVRGGYRSFLTTKLTKAGRSGKVAVGANNGSVLIGGTLRRSVHTAAWVDGNRVGGAASVDENGRAIPEYSTGPDIVVIVGTNSDYGAYVEIGTTKMAGRPFLGPAFESESGRFASLVRAGMKGRA